MPIYHSVQTNLSFRPKTKRSPEKSGLPHIFNILISKEWIRFVLNLSNSRHCRGEVTCSCERNRAFQWLILNLSRWWCVRFFDLFPCRGKFCNHEEVTIATSRQNKNYLLDRVIPNYVICQYFYVRHIIPSKPICLSVQKQKEVPNFRDFFIIRYVALSLSKRRADIPSSFRSRADVRWR